MAMDRAAPLKDSVELDRNDSLRSTSYRVGAKQSSARHPSLKSLVVADTHVGQRI